MPEKMKCRGWKHRAKYGHGDIHGYSVTPITLRDGSIKFVAVVVTRIQISENPKRFKRIICRHAFFDSLAEAREAALGGYKQAVALMAAAGGVGEVTFYTAPLDIELKEGTPEQSGNPGQHENSQAA